MNRAGGDRLGDEIPWAGPRCPECGLELEPELVASDRHLVVAFICPDHGPVAVADPF